MIKKLNYIFSTADKIKIVLLTVMILAGSMLELLAISLFSPFIDGIMNQDAMLESTVISVFYRLGSFGEFEHFLAALAGGIIAIYVIKTSILYWKKIRSTGLHTGFSGPYQRIC